MQISLKPEQERSGTELFDSCVLETNSRPNDCFKGFSRTSQVAGYYACTRDIILKYHENFLKNILALASMVQLVGVGLQSKRLWVRFPIRAHA